MHELERSDPPTKKRLPKNRLRWKKTLRTFPQTSKKLFLPVEVVLQEDLELLRLVDVGAGGDEVASGEPLVEGGVVPAVELVDGHLPDRVGARGAVVGVAVALVGHPA